ncbi:MAG: transcriptional repressor LexA [Patescibacteria group bacterium]
MKNELTSKQNKVLEVVKEFINKKGFSPTFRELRKILFGKGLKLKSDNSVVQYLNVLEEKGFIQKFKKVRGIRLLNETVKNFITIPLLGNANCGEALSFADDYIEDFINISRKHIKDKLKYYFFVKAMGDSMNKSGIKNGDLILVKKIEGEPIENQDIVVVINGLGVIKKFKKIDGTPVLLPNSTNLKHQPIILHSEDQIHICGKVEKVFGFSAMENSRNS